MFWRKVSVILSIHTKLHLFTLMRKYEVNVIAYSPGNVVVRIGSWWQYEEVFEEILTELGAEPQIYSITVDDNLVTVNFDSAILEDTVKIGQLLSLIKKQQL